MVRFTALCAGPRSQNDYIEIARNYQSVIVSDVPVLDSDHENEARRFIALVDELYDRHVNLIISAAAPPAELYRGERLSYAIPTHGESADGDAERGIPRERAHPLAPTASQLSLSAAPPYCGPQLVRDGLMNRLAILCVCIAVCARAGAADSRRAGTRFRNGALQ